MDFKKVIVSGLVLAAFTTVSCSKAEKPVEAAPAPKVEPIAQQPVEKEPVKEISVEPDIEAPAAELPEGANRIVIENAEQCEAEGGTFFETFCIVPVRPEEFHGEEYDNAGLGVIGCSGTLVNDDEYCRIDLK